jgi:CheY-like chemotaxis protein
MTKSTILYADDDLDDLFIVEQAFAPYADYINLMHVSDGSSALNCLKRLCNDGNEPCLILLDMNMPVMDGRQALMEIRNNQELCHLPVAVFTTSSNPADKDFARKWEASFFTKPLAFNDLQHLARTFVKMCAEEIPSEKNSMEGKVTT